VPAQAGEHQDEAKPPASRALDGRTDLAPPVDQSLLDQAVMGYIKDIFAEVLKWQPAMLGEQETFENFGVDSLVGMRILDRLEEDLGDLPSTLLFECITIEQLASHLSKQRRARLAALLQPKDEDKYARVPAQAGEHQAEAKPPASRALDGRTDPAPDDTAVISTSRGYPQPPDLGDKRPGQVKAPAPRGFDGRSQYSAD